jgi:hypothetical protein
MTMNKAYIYPPPPHEIPLTKTLFLLITTFILTLSLASCGEKSEDDSSSGITVIAQGVQVKDGTGMTNWSTIPDPTTFSDYNGILDFNYIANFAPGSSLKVTNGKLNMTLGTPKSEYLESLSWFIERGITVTPSNAKFVSTVDDGFPTSDEVYYLLCFKRLKAAYLTYADRNVTMKGTYSDYGEVYDYDCSFKKGWNYMLIERDISGDKYTYTSSQTLPSDYYWVVTKP